MNMLKYPEISRMELNNTVDSNNTSKDASGLVPIGVCINCLLKSDI